MSQHHQTLMRIFWNPSNDVGFSRHHGAAHANTSEADSRDRASLGSPSDRGVLMSDELAHREARLADIASLGGEAALDGLLQRFASHLTALLAQTGWPGSEIHRVVGLAGMLGFAEVEAAWRAIEDSPPGPPEAQSAARETAEAAIAYVARRASTSRH